MTDEANYACHSCGEEIVVPIGRWWLALGGLMAHPIRSEA